MKILKLKNEQILQFTDSSTINNLCIVVQTFQEIDMYREWLTEENLSDCEFDGVEYKDIILSSVSTISIGYGNIQANFYTTTSKSEEIEALKRQLKKLENQNEQLINENEQLSDKADAADILMGNEEV